jgi:SAM-dependent methyltransferase
VATTRAPDTTNVAKYRSRNPLVRGLIDRYFRRLGAVVGTIRHETVLDAGCGEGEVLERLSGSLRGRVVAVDVRPDCVAAAADRVPWAEVSRQSIDQLEFADGSFDLVLCLEVLEHLEDPRGALGELARVSSGDVVISVPWEPWFRLGSLARGRHLQTLGNHPEHVQRWGWRGLRELVADQLELVSLVPSFPWLLAHCHPRSSPR